MSTLGNTTRGNTMGRYKLVRREQGLALVISLVLLVAMTVIAIATMSGTRLNERLSSNAQQKAISFEAAESAISSVWDLDSLYGAVAVFSASAFNDPAPVTDTAKDTHLSNAFDQEKTVGGPKTVDIQASVTIQYCGEIIPNGTNISADQSANRMVGMSFDVNGISEVVGSNAKSDHLQRGSIPIYATGRTGNCVAPN